MKIFDQIMKENRITYWLMYGSLLGAVREGKMIEGDKDIDIGVFFEDLPKLYCLVDDPQKDIVQYFHGRPTYFTKTINGIVYDIQCWKKIGAYRYYPQFDFRYSDDDWFQQPLPADLEFSKIMFEGIECNIPKNYLELLEQWFSDWKTPSKQHSQTAIYKLKFDHFENPWQP